jgi:hypothetical protein
LNASDILCAGSVEIINTVSLVLASWTDREQLWRKKKTYRIFIYWLDWNGFQQTMVSLSCLISKLIFFYQNIYKMCGQSVLD